jgi:type I restriction enzyme M protein
MNAFGKTRLLTVEDFNPFEKAFGENPLGKSERKDEGEKGRFRFYSREQIASKGDNLDITWLRDTNNDPEDEMTEPDDIALAIIRHLRCALEEIEATGEELTRETIAETT